MVERRERELGLRSWHRANLLFGIGVGLWIVETLVFLVIYGWHVTAIGVEQGFDTLVIILVLLAAGQWVLAVNGVVRSALGISQKKQKGNVMFEKLWKKLRFKESDTFKKPVPDIEVVPDAPKRAPRVFLVPEDKIEELLVLADAESAGGRLERYRMWVFIGKLFPDVAKEEDVEWRADFSIATVPKVVEKLK